jgi:3-deoxy-7-phosphoheptulonate synthase
MIIVMRPNVADAELEGVTALISALALSAHVSRGAERTIVGVIGAPADKETLLAQFAQLDGVESVVPISKSYKLVSREARVERSIVRVRDGVSFGGNDARDLRGSVQRGIARATGTNGRRRRSRAGANVLRGGAFKPRTSPYAFQGLGWRVSSFCATPPTANGSRSSPKSWILRDVETRRALRRRACRSAPATCRTSRCCARRAARKRPVLLKRGIAATIEEWLMAAEYVVRRGQSRQSCSANAASAATIRRRAICSTSPRCRCCVR